jgi:hypothetical protein
MTEKQAAHFCLDIVHDLLFDGVDGMKENRLHFQ